MFLAIIAGILAAALVTCAILSIVWIRNKIKERIKNGVPQMVINPALLEEYIKEAKKNNQHSKITLEELDAFENAIADIDVIICDGDCKNVERIRATEEVDSKFKALMDSNNGILEISA